jgi:peroxiredoxin
MIQCPKCLAQNPQESRFCNACAEPLNSPSQMPAVDGPAMEFSRESAVPRPGIAIASLVLGIAACILSLFVVGALFGLIGLFLGLSHVFQKRGPNGMAWWGIGLSIVSILASAAMGVVFYRFAWTQMKNLTIASDSTFNTWIGARSPDVALTDLDGKRINLSQFKGKRVVLNFWATWCGPCVMEMPYFARLYKESSRDDLIIMGVSNEDEATVRAFVAKTGVNYPIALSRDLPLPYKNIKAIPTTFFIDRNGIVQSVLVGSQSFSQLKDRALTADFQGTPKTPPDGVPPMPDRAGFAGSLWGADPWVGTWKLNFAKSRLQSDISNIRESLVLYRQIDMDTVEITAMQVRKDGTNRVVWKCSVPKSGGMQTYQQGAPGEDVTIVKTVIDGHTQYLTYLQNGKQFDQATIALSQDGKTYKLSAKVQDGNGQLHEEVEIYEKQ